MPALFSKRPFDLWLSRGNHARRVNRPFQYHCLRGVLSRKGSGQVIEPCPAIFLVTDVAHITFLQHDLALIKLRYDLREPVADMIGVSRLDQPVWQPGKCS